MYDRSDTARLCDSLTLSTTPPPSCHFLSFPNIQSLRRTRVLGRSAFATARHGHQFPSFPPRNTTTDAYPSHQNYAKEAPEATNTQSFSTIASSHHHSASPNHPSGYHHSGSPCGAFSRQCESDPRTSHECR